VQGNLIVIKMPECYKICIDKIGSVICRDDKIRTCDPIPPPAGLPGCATSRKINKRWLIRKIHSSAYIEEGWQKELKFSIPKRTSYPNLAQLFYA